MLGIDGGYRWCLRKVRWWYRWCYRWCLRFWLLVVRSIGTIHTTIYRVLAPSPPWRRTQRYLARLCRNSSVVLRKPQFCLVMPISIQAREGRHHSEPSDATLDSDMQSSCTGKVNLDSTLMCPPRLKILKKGMPPLRFSWSLIAFTVRNPSGV